MCKGSPKFCEEARWAYYHECSLSSSCCVIEDIDREIAKPSNAHFHAWSFSFRCLDKLKKFLLIPQSIDRI